MTPPWMPLYIADYLADTMHLRAAESGAYLHLIMHYWQHKGIPNDDRQLAAIAKMTDFEWSNARALLAPFFDEGWRHGRIDAELAKAEEKYLKRVNAGRAGGKAKRKQNGSNASPVLPAMLNQPQPEKKEERDGARAREAMPTARADLKISPEAHSTAAECRRIASSSESDFCGLEYQVDIWIRAAYTPQQVVGAFASAVGRYRQKPWQYVVRVIETNLLAQRELPKPQIVGGIDGPSWASSKQHRQPEPWQQRRDDYHTALAEFGAGLEAAKSAHDRGGGGGADPPAVVTPARLA